MKILILGFSSIARRRALPALLLIDSVSAIDIASKHTNETQDLPDEWNGKLYSDYDTALQNSNADIVYISLINSLHEEWAEAALLANKHVIIDKPAFLSLPSTERLISIADKMNVCLAEATVFNYHPQYDEITSLVKPEAHFLRIVSVFSFPPFAATDFRNFPELGGGALLDLGPYVAATSRLFFSEQPDHISCHINSVHSEFNIETAFSILAVYPHGGSFVGHFGFDTEYQNRLILLGPEIAISLERAYTTPPNMENVININQKNSPKVIKAAKSDTFRAFFQHVFDSVARNNWHSLTDDLLQDATFREQLKLSAGVKLN